MKERAKGRKRDRGEGMGKGREGERNLTGKGREKKRTLPVVVIKPTYFPSAAGTDLQGVIYWIQGYRFSEKRIGLLFYRGLNILQSRSFLALIKVVK